MRKALLPVQYARGFVALWDKTPLSERGNLLHAFIDLLIARGGRRLLYRVRLALGLIFSEKERWCDVRIVSEKRITPSTIAEIRKAFLTQVGCRACRLRVISGNVGHGIAIEYNGRKIDNTTRQRVKMLKKQIFYGK